MAEPLSAVDVVNGGTMNRIAGIAGAVGLVAAGGLVAVSLGGESSSGPEPAAVLARPLESSTVPQTVAPEAAEMEPMGAMAIPGVVGATFGGGSNERLVVDDGEPGIDIDGTGNFRMTCGSGSHHAYDDPIVFPGGSGESHLHTFFGNVGTDANSTHESLVAEPAGSTCAGGDVNKSSYWYPSVIDGLGDDDPATNVAVDPILNYVYYKSGNFGQEPSEVVPIPAGLRMIAGDATAATPQETWIAGYACTSTDGAGVISASYQESMPQCPTDEYLGLRVLFPQCWNGADLDSADHKSHMSYASFQGECPATHPVMLPEITVHATFPVSGSGDYSSASDMMTPSNAPPGQGLHSDFFDAWDPDSMQALIDNCVGVGLDCGVRSLGNGLSLLDVESS